ncbi:MAG: molybdopterin molybdotransferase MoeA [Candidatus Lambdaproteobacteria bacterium]|nr:molybdopterin molybdotransferase MoeA [Candidatus Lambdaproteobacteria bacterium]
MIPFAQALEIVLGKALPIAELERVPLAAAAGRHLAEDVLAREDIPIAANSAMDGYAVIQADVADAARCARRPLAIADVLPAEAAGSRPLRPGEAMQLMTGTPIPPGADAVVMIEHTRREGDRVWISQPPRPGDHIRPAGGDFRRGALALRRGERLGAAQLGLLAALGYAEVPVVRRPRVGVLATGNEIIAPAEPLVAGKVRNANSFTLMALATESGAEARFLGIAHDDPAELRDLLERGLAEFDVLVTSGGVSMGDFDYVKRTVEEVDIQVLFREVNVKPGKPVVFGSRGRTLFFGLPGNPVSSMVMFLQLVRPVLLRMAHQQQTGFRTLRVPLGERIEKRDGKRHFLRGVLQSNAAGLRVRLTGEQASNLLHSMGRANCLVVIEEERTVVVPGEPVTVELLEGDPLPA